MKKAKCGYIHTYIHTCTLLIAIVRAQKNANGQLHSKHRAARLFLLLRERIATCAHGDGGPRPEIAAAVLLRSHCVCMTPTPCRPTERTGTSSHWCTEGGQKLLLLLHTAAAAASRGSELVGLSWERQQRAAMARSHGTGNVCMGACCRLRADCVRIVPCALRTAHCAAGIFYLETGRALFARCIEAQPRKGDCLVMRRFTHPRYLRSIEKSVWLQGTTMVSGKKNATSAPRAYAKRLHSIVGLTRIVGDFPLLS